MKVALAQINTTVGDFDGNESKIRSAYQRGSAGSSSKTVSVHRASQTFRKVVEVPKDAQNVHFYRSAQKLPARYKSAMQNIK